MSFNVFELFFNLSNACYELWIVKVYIFIWLALQNWGHNNSIEDFCKLSILITWLIQLKKGPTQPHEWVETKHCHRMVNVCRLILRHIKEYCEEAAIHGPQHIVAHRLAIFERLVPIQLASDCIANDCICLEKIIA